MEYRKIGEKTVVGIVEPVMVFNKAKKRRDIMAKIDTGACKGSLDMNLVSELGLGPIIESKIIKSASGNKLRPVIEVEIELAGKRMKEEFTLADRRHMKYKVLIGRNVLRHGYLIDPRENLRENLK